MSFLWPTHVVMVVALVFAANQASAQDRYSTFAGEYSAAHRIATSCQGLVTVGVKNAGTIAKSEDGLRKQKVLRLLYYGKTAWLNQEGDAALAARNVTAGNKTQLCRFGRKVAGKRDRIGRFLRVK